jgi:ABC-type branched-subunit amino acid transport system substrate-binding protein
MSKKPLILAGCLALVSAYGAASAEGPAGRAAPHEPFLRLRQHEADYAGPGREEPPPEQVEEVLLGYFGPGDPAHPEGGDLWTAAQMAVERANREGGYRGKPFRIVARWSENPWGTGVAQVVRMVYRDRVWAIVGGIDGPSTHLAEQVVAKARLPLLSPVSTDKTANLANVAWLFSLPPGDHLLAPVLAETIAERGAAKRFVLVSATDHDSRLFTAELSKCLTARRMLPRYHFQSDPAEPETAPLVTRVLTCVSQRGDGPVESRLQSADQATSSTADRLKAELQHAGPDAVVLVAGAEHSARLLVGLRDAGFTGAVFGGPAMGRRRFLERSGDAAEAVRFPLLYTPPKPLDPFAKAFQERTGKLPDYAAAQTYDAFRLLVTAVRDAGLNRARVRDALSRLSPYSGASGTVTWDPLGSNTRAPRLGTVRNGRVIPSRGPAAKNRSSGVPDSRPDGAA